MQISYFRHVLENCNPLIFTNELPGEKMAKLRRITGNQSCIISIFLKVLTKVKLQ